MAVTEYIDSDGTPCTLDAARLLAAAEPHLDGCEIMAARRLGSGANWPSVERLARAAPDLARRCIALDAERAEEEARAERYADALNALEATGSEGERIRAWREHEAALVRLRGAARRVLALTAADFDEDQEAAFDALRAALGEGE